MLKKLLHKTSYLKTSYLYVIYTLSYNTILPSRHWITAMYIKHFIFLLIAWLSIPTNRYISCCMLFHFNGYYLVNLSTKMQQYYSHKKSQIYWLFKVNLKQNLICDAIRIFIVYSTAKSVTAYLYLQSMLKHDHRYIFLYAPESRR